MTVRPAYMGALCCMASLCFANAAVYGRFGPLVGWLLVCIVVIAYGKEVRSES